MARPSKLTSELQQRIGDNIALGLIYSLAAEAAGITYKTFNLWMQRRQTDKSGKYYLFYKYIQKCNADAAKELLVRLNDAAKSWRHANMHMDSRTSFSGRLLQT